MKNWLQKKFHNEKGLTLVEVIASVVIITIILLSVYYIFVQSNKTTNTSGEIVDATYVAQTEMEKFYSISKANTLPNNFETEVFPGYLFVNKDGEHFIYKNDTAYSEFSLELKLKQTDNLTRIILKVKDKNNNTKAQMETTLDWEG